MMKSLPASRSLLFVFIATLAAGAFVATLALALAPASALALDGPAAKKEVEYVPLVYIPDVTEYATQPSQIVNILNQLFYLALWALVAFAVVMITFYGLTWILSEVVPEKVDAKRRIGEIIFGLILILGTYIILNTINPDILNLNIWQVATSTSQVKIPEIKIPPNLGSEGSPVRSP
ncbi:MAG: hypothetical protein KatS3mg100_219 [Candidatus Parcubacteria bacterium]|nr:MAG: hypothetical protein KatS3mg100_219 [Candidatus Parcubacteria bacterium]